MYQLNIKHSVTFFYIVSNIVQVLECIKNNGVWSIITIDKFEALSSTEKLLI